jgi:hypothetical protein
MTEHKRVLYINQWLGLDELNLILGDPENSELEIVYITTLNIKVDDLKLINFPFTMTDIFIDLNLDNYLFMDNIFTNRRLGEYLSNEFLDYWKIPFDCKLTFKISQNVWNMELDKNKEIFPDQKYCEWIISGNKIVYSSMDSFESIGINQKTERIISNLFKERVRDIIFEDKGYKIKVASFVAPV